MIALAREISTIVTLLIEEAQKSNR